MPKKSAGKARRRKRRAVRGLAVDKGRGPGRGATQPRAKLTFGAPGARSLVADPSDPSSHI